MTDESTDDDLVYPRVQKEAADDIALPITLICLISLETGIVPEMWKKQMLDQYLKRMIGMRQETTDQC
jgi:hypothetical protein